MIQRIPLYKLERNLISLFAVVDSLFDDDKKTGGDTRVLVCELMLAGDFVCSILAAREMNNLAGHHTFDSWLEHFRTKWSARKYLQADNELRVQVRTLLYSLLDVIDEMKNDSMEDLNRKSMLLSTFLASGEVVKELLQLSEHPATV